MPDIRKRASNSNTIQPPRAGTSFFKCWRRIEGRANGCCSEAVASGLANVKLNCSLQGYHAEAKLAVGRDTGVRVGHWQKSIRFLFQH